VLLVAKIAAGVFLGNILFVRWLTGVAARVSGARRG
jgi:hypothetical protein